ncbi:hypothetical protein JG688_00013454, partial [Phytophthora aleatoria]
TIFQTTLEPTVDRALGQLKETLSEEQLRGDQVKIQLDSDGEIPGGSDGYVAIVEKVGTFTRDQVENMTWVWNLQVMCRRGIPICTWLNSEEKKTSWTTLFLRAWHAIRS